MLHYKKTKKTKTYMTINNETCTISLFINLIKKTKCSKKK